jgi:hypothetical protein
MSQSEKQTEAKHRSVLVRFENPETQTAIAEFKPGEDTLVVNAYRLAVPEVRILRQALIEFEAQAPAAKGGAS